MNLFKRIIKEEAGLLFSCPAILWQLFFLYIPVLVLVLYSFFDYPFFTLAAYRPLFSAIYLTIIFHSFMVALFVASVSLFIAYPVAYFFVMKVPERFKTLLLFSIILPSWTSLIIQIYAWFFLLDKNSFLSLLFYKLGILSSSTTLLNSYLSILIVMTGVYLPFMILPIYTVLDKMDKRLLEASADLGANRFQTFRRVIFPMSLPGVYAGFLLVFLPAFGEFAIPTLLGGSKTIFWGNLIVDKFLVSRDWRSGAALTVIGISFVALVISCFYTITKLILKTRRRLSRNNQKRKLLW